MTATMRETNERKEQVPIEEQYKQEYIDSCGLHHHYHYHHRRCQRRHHHRLPLSWTTRTSMMMMIFILILILFFLVKPSMGIIRLGPSLYPGETIMYDSTTASFGGTLENGIEYKLNLVLAPKDDPTFCGHNNALFPTSRQRQRQRQRTLSTQRQDNREEVHSSTTKKGKSRRRKTRVRCSGKENGHSKCHSIKEVDEDLRLLLRESPPPPPSSSSSSQETSAAASIFRPKDNTSDGNRRRPHWDNVPNTYQFPIAVLAQRGGCFFETKARYAQSINQVLDHNLSTETPHHHANNAGVHTNHTNITMSKSDDVMPSDRIAAVIVYNNMTASGLFSMAPRNKTTALDIHIQMLLVGFESGLDLQHKLNYRAYTGFFSHANASSSMAHPFLIPPPPSSFLPLTEQAERGDDPLPSSFSLISYGWYFPISMDESRLKDVLDKSQPSSPSPSPPLQPSPKLDNRGTPTNNIQPSSSSSTNDPLNEDWSQEPWVLILSKITFAFLVALPMIRLSFIWYRAGGRIRFVRGDNNGGTWCCCWWYAVEIIPATIGPFSNGMWDDNNNNNHDGIKKLSQAQVLDLPQVTYQASADDDENNENDEEYCDDDDLECGEERFIQEEEEEIQTNPLDIRSTTDSISMDETSKLPKMNDLVQKNKDNKQITTSSISPICLPITITTNNKNKNNNITYQDTTTTSLLYPNNNKKQTTTKTTKGPTMYNGKRILSTMCSICIDEFEIGEQIRILPRCNHGFHTDCLMPWLTERSASCPTCKTMVLLEHDNNDDVDMDMDIMMEEEEENGESQQHQQQQQQQS